MSELGSESSAGGLEAQRSRDGGCAPIETWRAVIVSTDYRYQSESLKPLPAKCKEAEDCVHLKSGEKGISMGTKQYPQERLHRVYLVRYGTGFYGQAQRANLESLGLRPDIASRVFDDAYFYNNVDKMCTRLLTTGLPSTLRGLIDRCDKQSSDWPPDGTSVVYVRAYTNLDLGPNQTASDDMGAYCGFTINAQRRDGEHKNGIVKCQANPRNTLRPTHYDVASRAPANGRHVFIVMSQFGTEGLKTGGTPEPKRMAEQTIMLMLQTYAPWLNTLVSMDATVQCPYTPKDRKGRSSRDRLPAQLAAVGGYRDFGAANALGIRVEWKHHTKDEWFTARLQAHWRMIRKARKGLRAGDATAVEELYQRAMALIQLVRGEDYPEAPEGFWRPLAVRGARPTVQKLEVDHMKQMMRWITACPPCAALGRCCTFTPRTALLAGWIGKDWKEVNPQDYVPVASRQAVPAYGAGPIRELVPHLSMPEPECDRVIQIDKPFEWDSLCSVIDPIELGEEDGDGMATDEEDEEDEDE
ncbi:uncharacterized protein B0T15DRAFT_511772 [Chaetomium strumarium]|uniref:Uncharacterized protein n=1 Tax=Chaetomium strumarium TaxID=1170767 RepID=A0AAJ0GTJ5_9PEZI|nr:hypothetical protein B0T15DRAFT_511772 [Chaetomium strumarium]